MERVIGALVAIALAIWAMSSVLGNSDQAKSDQKGSTITTDVAFIMTKARSGMAQNNTGYTNFTNANMTSLINAGTFPSSMVKNGVVYDKWGNPVTLGSANNGTNGTIAFGGGSSETADECVTAVTGMNGYDTILVNATTFTAANKPDLSTAGAACSATAAITVTFH
jgi:hypothetical protein